MHKPVNTTSNTHMAAAGAHVIDQATQPVLHQWQKPRFERIPLNEALSAVEGITTDSTSLYS